MKMTRNFAIDVNDIFDIWQSEIQLYNPIYWMATCQIIDAMEGYYWVVVENKKLEIIFQEILEKHFGYTYNKYQNAHIKEDRFVTVKEKNYFDCIDDKRIKVWFTSDRWGE